MKKDKFYRNNYMIGLYDDNDFERLVYLFDNTKDFADFFEITMNNATNLLWNFFHKHTTHVNYKGTYYSVHFIRIDEEIY